MSNDVSLGLAHEVELRLRKAGATKETFWDPISQSDALAEEVMRVVKDWITDGWMEVPLSNSIRPGSALLGAEYGPDRQKFRISDLVLREFAGDRPSAGEVLKRTQEWNARLKQQFGEALLQRQDRIPNDWRRHRLVFAGSVWVRGEMKMFFCAIWHKGANAWIKDYVYIDEFGPGDRLVCLDARVHRSS